MAEIISGNVSKAEIILSSETLLHSKPKEVGNSRSRRDFPNPAPIIKRRSACIATNEPISRLTRKKTTGRVPNFHIRLIISIEGLDLE